MFLVKSQFMKTCLLFWSKAKSKVTSFSEAEFSTITETEMLLVSVVQCWGTTLQHGRCAWWFWTRRLRGRVHLSPQLKYSCEHLSLYLSCRFYLPHVPPQLQQMLISHFHTPEPDLEDDSAGPEKLLERCPSTGEVWVWTFLKTWARMKFKGKNGGFNHKVGPL